MSVGSASINEDDFIGKQGLSEWKQRGLRKAFVSLEIHGVKDADAKGSKVIYKDSEVVGRAASGDFGRRCEKSLTLGPVEPGWHEIGTELEFEILGELFKFTVIEESPYDPQNEKLLR